MGEILDCFDRVCRDRGRSPAIWSRDEALSLTFEGLAERVTAWQARLEAAHLPPRSLVAAAVGNRIDFPALFLALLRLGHPMVSLDGSLPREERIELCRKLGIPTLVHRSDARATGGGALSLAPPAIVSVAVKAPIAVGDGTVLVKLTSGSTGAPAGVCLREAALAAGIRSIGEGMEIGPADRMLMAIPLSHSYGFDHGVLSLAVLGTSLVLENRFFPASLLRALAEGEVTFFPAVPPMVKALAESSWPAGLPLRRVISAGGPLIPEFAHRFHAASGRHVHQFYGSTETGGISFEPAPHEPGALATVGRPLPGVSITLDDRQTVVVDSAANFHGLLGQPAREQRPVTLADRGEWTSCGRLRLTGRTADLLNVGGRRLSAGAVEAALRGIEGIHDAAVVGIADPVRGDRVVAFVVGGAEVAGSDLPTGLAARDVRPLDALPYTGRGKLDRARLRSLALDEKGS